MTKTYGNFTDFIDFSRASSGTALRKVSYGAELVTNGTFDSDTSGWTGASSAVLSVSSQRMRITNGATSYGYAVQGISTVAGKVYYVTYSVQSGTANASLFIGTTSGGFEIYNSPTRATGNYTQTFVAQSSTTYIRLGLNSNTSGFYCDVDNISVKEVTFDQADGTLELFNHPAGIPRIEYDANGNGIGLLIEEQRTNLVTYSEDFTDASWTKSTSTVSLSGTAPDGGSSYKLIPNNTATNGHISVNAAVTTVAYTFSFYAKAAEESSVSFVTNMDGVFKANVFNLSTGIASSASGWTCVMEAVGSGWYRCSSTATAAAATTYGFQIGNNSAGWTGDGTSGIYIWGAQLEQGSFPTSYIPTSGATATRSADIADIATANFGYNPKAGTLVVEFSHLGRPSSTNIGVIYGGATNARWVYSNTGSDDHYTYDGTTSITHGSVPVGQISKLAVAVNSTTQQSSLDGASVVSASHNGNISQNTTVFNIGTNHNSGDVMSGHIKSLSYRPRRNTNTQLQEFTS